MDDEGNEVEEGKPGEVLVKAPIVTKGYYNNPQATKDAFVDGWFCTGDIAVWRNGLPYIVDRKKVWIAFLFKRTILCGSRSPSDTRKGANEQPGTYQI